MRPEMLRDPQPDPVSFAPQPEFLFCPAALCKFAHHQALGPALQGFFVLTTHFKSVF
jgi:hypothetical protein